MFFKTTGVKPLPVAEQSVEGGDGTGSRKALLISCRPAGKDEKSTAPSQHDIACMTELLTRSLGYSPDNIKVLSLESKDNFKPTKKNILSALEWLRQGQHRGTRLFLYFTGHCKLTPKVEGITKAYFQTGLVPSDVEQSGLVTEDDLHKALVSQIWPGVSLHILLDAGYSGAGLGLPYSGSCKGLKKESAIYKLKRCSSEPGVDTEQQGLIFCLGAADQMQPLQQLTATPAEGGYSFGACTKAFIRAVETLGPTNTYGDLMDRMYVLLRGWAHQIAVRKADDVLFKEGKACDVPADTAADKEWRLWVPAKVKTEKVEKVDQHTLEATIAKAGSFSFSLDSMVPWNMAKAYVQLPFISSNKKLVLSTTKLAI